MFHEKKQKQKCCSLLKMPKKSKSKSYKSYKRYKTKQSKNKKIKRIYKRKSSSLKDRALLFLDVASSSKMWKSNPTQMSNLLNMFEQLVNNTMKSFSKQNNYIVKTIGDAYMICFETWQNALKFALTLQQSLVAQTNQPFILNYGNNESMPFAIRIGIAYGPVEEKVLHIQNCNMKDLFGNTVNTASRMESKVSSIGGIGITCLSKDTTTLQQFVDKLVQILEKNKLEFKILSFKSICSRQNVAQNVIDNVIKIKSRSDRLITQLHDNYSCETAEKLHGVDDVDICFKIEVNKY